MSDTKDVILDAAKMLFTQKGYDATSMELIAKEVGFTKAALYYHFKSKEDIFAEIMKRTTLNALSYIDAPTSLQADMINKENLEVYILKLFDFFIKERDVLTIALVEYLKENRDSKSLMLELHSYFFSYLENIVSIPNHDRALILLTAMSFVLFEGLKEKISDNFDADKNTLEEIVKYNTSSLLLSLILKNESQR